MTMTPEERDAKFEGIADDMANILREFMRRWGAEEQVGNDMPEDDARRRAFIGYNYASGDQHANVFMELWVGPTGTIVESREGKALHMEHSERAYLCGTLRVEYIPEQGDDYRIDEQYMVHSAGELRDRMLVMWNSDHWRLNHPYVDENAMLYRSYFPVRSYFDQQMKPVGVALAKLGKAWGADPQADNQATPEADRGGLLSGLRGSGGKKWYFVGYTTPLFKTNEEGEARVTRGTVSLDLWTGKPGKARRGKWSRRVEHGPKTNPTRIVIDFMGDHMHIRDHDIRVPDAAALKTTLVKLWKADAFNLP